MLGGTPPDPPMVAAAMAPKFGRTFWVSAPWVSLNRRVFCNANHSWGLFDPAATVIVVGLTCVMLPVTNCARSGLTRDGRSARGAPIEATPLTWRLALLLWKIRRLDRGL